MNPTSFVTGFCDTCENEDKPGSYALAVDGCISWTHLFKERCRQHVENPSLHLDEVIPPVRTCSRRTGNIYTWGAGPGFIWHSRQLGHPQVQEQGDSQAHLMSDCPSVLSVIHTMTRAASGGSSC